jgi:hypothetical protein
MRWGTRNSMPIGETLPNIITKEKYPPRGGKGGTKREDRCPTKRQHSSVQKHNIQGKSTRATYVLNLSQVA